MTRVKIPTVPRESTEVELPAAYAFLDPAQRGEIATHQPRVVFIEVTNACNLLCETCPRTFVTYEEPKTLGWSKFLEIVDQFPDMQRAVLHGVGEPLMNRDLVRMVRHLKSRDITVLFNTNVVLLNDKLSRELIDSGLDELRCSLDAATPAMYQRIRGAPVFQKVVNNLARFTEIQRELGATTPKPSIWMTGMRENIDELPDLVRLAGQINVPEVYVQRMVYYLDNDQPPGLMGAGHALFDDFDAHADQIIGRAELIARELGVTLKASGATDPRRSYEQAKSRDPKPWSACLRPWTTAYVTANGNCLPCCISPFATSDYESLKLGNLFEQPFNSIWNNDRYQQWRVKLLSERPPGACEGCGVHWSL